MINYVIINKLIKKIMYIYKILITSFFLFFLNLSSILYAETLKFSSSMYEGEVKKGKANGNGTFTFSDGSKYEGMVKKNKIHGTGKYTDAEGNVYQGKWKYGKIIEKIDNSTRKVVKLNLYTGTSNHVEKRGTGSAINEWFEAELATVNSEEIKLKAVGELDIFDLPSTFSPDYGDPEKIIEILNSKNEKIISENALTSKNPTNTKTVYKFTAKGKRNMQQAQATIALSSNNDEHTSTVSGGHGGGEGGGMGGGGPC